MTKHQKLSPEDHERGLTVNELCLRFPRLDWLLSGGIHTKLNAANKSVREAIMVAGVEDGCLASKVPAKVLTEEEVKVALMELECRGGDVNGEDFIFLLACPNPRCRAGNIRPVSMKKHKCSKVRAIDMTIFAQIPLEVESKHQGEDEDDDTPFENTITPTKAPLIHLALAPPITHAMASTRLLPVPQTLSHQTSTSSLVTATTPFPPSQSLTKDHHHQNSISPPSSSVSSSASSSRRAHDIIGPSSTAAGGGAGNGAIKVHSPTLAEYPPPSISLATPYESRITRFETLPSTNAYDCSSSKSGRVSATSSSTLDSEDDDWDDFDSSSNLGSGDDDGDDIVAAGGPAVDHRRQRARQRALAQRKLAQLVRDWQKFDAAHTRCRSLVKDMLLRGRLACKLSLGPDQEEIVEEVRREEEAAEEERMKLMEMEMKRGTRVLHPVEMEERRERKNDVAATAAAAAATTATATGAATGPAEGSAEQADLSTESQTDSAASGDTSVGTTGSNASSSTSTSSSSSLPPPTLVLPDDGEAEEEHTDAEADNSDARSDISSKTERAPEALDEGDLSSGSARVGDGASAADISVD
ncbi:hypothetical protein CF326_g4308 [Tilletia indica]|nr:hypothetical protein CF326_g4308 [Tilletia indica]